MPALQQTTRLHEDTVKNAEQHEGTIALPRSRKRGLTFPVETKQVANPLAWRTALKLAGHDASRLEVIDFDTVRVKN